MSVIDEVKQRTDIVEVISQYASLTKAGRTFRALCPFHSEKHPSFFVYPEQQNWHCFGACSTGGDAFSFIMKKQAIDFGEALHLLAQRAGVTIPSRFEPDASKDEKNTFYQANEAAARYFHNLLLNSPDGEKARSYVASRGFSPKTITEFQLGFNLNSWETLKQYLMERGYTESELLAAGLIVETENGKTHDRFRSKLMFPICDAKGRVAGFGARMLNDSLPKYINSPQTPIFDKSSHLYGINLATAAIKQQGIAVIVEGYIDVITAHQNGFNNVIACMGTSVTETQVNILKRLTRNIALALDADTAGNEAMLRCVGYENTLDTEIKVIILPRGKDPDDIIKQDVEIWQHLLEEALPVVDYTFDKATFQLDLTTARDKTLAVTRLLPIIAEIKDPVRQAHYLQKLASLVKVSVHTIEVALNRMKPTPTRRKTPESKPTAVTHALRPLISNPREEYCLALLLQHPELKDSNERLPALGGLLAEYFVNSENREIFIAWQQANDLASLKDKLDPAIWEHLDSLITRSLLPNQIEQKYTECVLNLQKEFLRSLETKKEAMLAQEAEAGGTAAELAKLEEQGIEVSIQLGQVFTQKGRRGQ